MSIKTPKTLITTIKARRITARHEKMIKASQSKLAETTLVPGCVTIYA